jgi:hypothetical protein
MMRTSSTAEMHRPLTGRVAPPVETAAEPVSSEERTGSPGWWREDSPSEAVRTVQCAHCGKINPVQNSSCESCGASLSEARDREAATLVPEPAPEANKPAPTAEAEGPVTPSLPLPAVEAAPTEGAAENSHTSKTEEYNLTGKIYGDDLTSKSILQSDGMRRRKSAVPILELLVAALLLFGAAAAVWMLHSSLPAKNTATAAKVEILLTPTAAEVTAGNALDLSATVTGTDDVDVKWVVQEGDKGGRIIPRGAKAQAGQVSSLVVYLAPPTPGDYHVLVTSKAFPQKSASAEIKVEKATSR